MTGKFASANIKAARNYLGKLQKMVVDWDLIQTTDVHELAFLQAHVYCVLKLPKII